MLLDETATEQFLTVDQVASRYNTSTCSIYRWKSEGDFPQAVHLGNPPTRHPVREHERHYRSGKVVLIKEHHRGQAPDPGLPTRVMGPRLNAADFAFPADK